MSALELYDEKHGSPGPQTPLLLVHCGAGTIGTNWEFAIPVFADDRLVIGVELPGHGHTAHSSRPYTFDNSADDLAAIGAPALFVSGDRDVVRPEHTLRMAQVAHAGRPLVLPAGNGDYLGAVDAGEVDRPLADSSLALIKRFLDETL